MFSKKKKEENMLALREAYDPQNPYALGRREYNDMYERLAKNAASWRRVAFFMLLFLAVSVSIVLWMAQSVKVVPFIVQVDEHGYEIAVQAVAPAGVTDDRVVIARLGDFITNTRSIYNDRAATMALVVKAYDSVAAGSAAQRKLDQYFRDNNPLTVSNLVAVSLQSVLRAAPENNKLWQAEWSERSYHNGQFVEEKLYKGMFETDINSPTNLQEIMKNPLGVFITDFNITERLPQLQSEPIAQQSQ